MELNRRQITEMEQMLPKINRLFISLQKDEITENSKILTSVLKKLKTIMKEVDPFFKAYVSQIDYSGSYYDGLKVKPPNEYDMNVIIKLPINYPIDIEIENSPLPGYVKLKIIRAFDNLKKQQNWETINKVTLDWLNDKKYFKQSKFREWMESVVNKAMNKLAERNGKKVIYIGNLPYELSLTKSGPAMTIAITPPSSSNIDVDFVPVLQFSAPQWPLGKKSRKMENCEKKQWFAVPKPIKEGSIIHNVADICWRTHFKEQENYLLHNKYNFKTALRLMKKMRDNIGLTQIASYYIKTLFLWELDNDNETLLTQPLSIIFLTMLEKLQIAVQANTILYFWNKDLNLLRGVQPITLTRYSNIIKSHLNAIEADSSHLLDLLLSEQENIAYHNSELPDFRKLSLYNDSYEQPTQQVQEPPIQQEQQVNENKKKKRKRKSKLNLHFTH